MTRLLALLAAALLAALPGCASDPTAGYSTMTVFPQGFSTVAVPIFENDTYVREIEFELTDAVIKEIEARTPYKVDQQRTADTILIGRVRKVDLDQLSKSRLTGLGEEVVVSVTIDFEWRDLSTETAIVRRQEFAGNALFVPSNPTGERIELGRTAVVQQLARDLVSEMRGAW